MPAKGLRPFFIPPTSSPGNCMAPRPAPEACAAPRKQQRSESPGLGESLRVCFNLVESVSGGRFQMPLGLVHHLRENIGISDGQIRDGLAGLKCRCGTHMAIMRAVKRAAKDMA